MKINSERCMACGICSDVCQVKAIVYGGTGKYTAAAIDPKKCVECGACKSECPADCISDK